MRAKREMDFETRAYLAELRREKRGTSARQVRERQHATAQAEADAWNTAHPIGTAVTVTMDDGSVRHTRTRSIAWRICDHASVMVDGISGGYLLSRVKPDPMALRVVSEPRFDEVDETGEAGA